MLFIFTTLRPVGGNHQQDTGLRAHYRDYGSTSKMSQDSNNLLEFVYKQKHIEPDFVDKINSYLHNNMTHIYDNNCDITIYKYCDVTLGDTHSREYFRCSNPNEM